MSIRLIGLEKSFGTKHVLRGLDLEILTHGYGEENGLMRSYQATTPALGMVLPSNSPPPERPST